MIIIVICIQWMQQITCQVFALLRQNNKRDSLVRIMFNIKLHKNAHLHALSFSVLEFKS